MRELDIAMAMICQVDKYHLQHRTGRKEIGAAGLIGCFGGKMKPGESSLEAVSRELKEETSVVVQSAGLREIDNFSVASDHNLEPVTVNTYVVEVLLPYGQEVMAHEGKLITWDREEILTARGEGKLTPATGMFFERYFK